MRALLYYPLAWLTDPRLAESILGDLEELRGRRIRSSRMRATWWFWRAALGVLLHALVQRARAVAATVWSSGAGTRGSGGDLHHAIRALRRTPVFTVVAVLLLALGTGANTAVLSIVRSVMLRPLPYREPSSLVFVWKGTDTAPGNRHGIMTGTHVIEIGSHQTTLESVAAFKGWNIGLDAQIDLLRSDGAVRLRGAQVTPNFFELLGVPPALGRTLSSADGSAQPVAVISHGLWQREFGGRAGVVGTRVLLARGREKRSNPAYTIVGVLPRDFRFTYPEETQIYVVHPWSEITRSRALQYGLVARLKPGVTPGQAGEELTVLAHNVLRSYDIPAEHLGRMLEREAMMAEPLSDHLVAEVRPGLIVLTVVSFLVLVIACVNIGLLVAARTIDRTGELAVRAALGAGPARIVRLLIVEGAVLASLGGAAGLLLAWLALPAVRTRLPAVVPRADQIGIDGWILAVAMATTALTALVSGVAPAVVTLQRDLLTRVRRSGSAATADRGVARARSWVVGVQVAVVMVLLVGAGLLLRSFWRLQNVPLGFEAGRVLTFETRLLNPRYQQRGAVAAFERELLARIRSIPGVASAAISTSVPMRGVDFLQHLGLPGQPTIPANWRAVDPDYFSILRIPLLAGRAFAAADAAGAPLVVVLSRQLADRLFPGTSPIGRELHVNDRPRRVVGVVGDVRQADLSREAGAAYYLPRAQYPVELICVLVRPQPGMHEHVAESLRHVVRSVDPEQPVEGLTTIRDIVSKAASDKRFYALATGAFAAVALLLAIAGVFGLVSRSVSERRRELAIRVALGADPPRLVRHVFGFGIAPVIGGATVGSLAALAGSRGMAPLLFEVRPTDPLTYSIAAVVMIAVALVACLRPVSLAVRMQPMVALRNE